MASLRLACATVDAPSEKKKWGREKASEGKGKGESEVKHYHPSGSLYSQELGVLNLHHFSPAC